MADIPRDDFADDAADIVDLGVTGQRPPADPDVVELRDDDEDGGLPPQAVLGEDGSVLLPLARPVSLKFRSGQAGTVREERFEELRFHPLTGADMRVIQAQKQDNIMPTAIAKSTRLHEGKMNAVYDRLDARDATAAQLVVLHFLGNGQKTGR